ncbi:hypothetical protein NLJ89_g973 [Agrocybe chaxingu]|uniref:Uncharacterized protein n=1 Tax=Agrocybe chaxingu TaxID=84603 RepID=A0A9W8N0X8_9AGAR|nr:hypothetical protein NLJ89_g973 [Agrocybe chaxingu]
MERLSQNFEALRQKEDIGDTEYYTYLEMRERAKKSARAYRESIRTYKDVALLDFLRKRKAKHQVRQKKEEMRMANQSLRDHYHDSMSECFDVSSIKGESGSRPGSALYSEFIRDYSNPLKFAPRVPRFLSAVLALTKGRRDGAGGDRVVDDDAGNDIEPPPHPTRQTPTPTNANVKCRFSIKTTSPYDPADSGISESIAAPRPMFK